MKPEFLDYFDRELRYIQELASEFGKDFPNLAPHLGLDRPACDDPYVERLLEGFAFLTARVQLRIDEEFPRFEVEIVRLGKMPQPVRKAENTPGGAITPPSPGTPPGGAGGK